MKGSAGMETYHSAQFRQTDASGAVCYCLKKSGCTVEGLYTAATDLFLSPNRHAHYPSLPNRL
jgi:hypothetical protein